MPTEYKYKCRPCPPHIRRQCIEEAQMSPGVKRIIERSFHTHTDTQATWDVLQRNCLLVRRDEMLSGMKESRQQGGLLSRLQKRAQEQAADESLDPAGAPSPPTERAPRRADAEGQDPAAGTRPVARPSRPIAQRKPETPSIAEQMSRQAQERKTEQIPEFPSTQQLRSEPQAPLREILTASRNLQYPRVTRSSRMPTLARGMQMMVAATTGHRIRLPEEGDLVFGRFDPVTRVTPDVDLSYEDRADRGVSRRHCQITGWRGQYEAKDLGSSNGTWVNGVRLQLQEKQALQIGDEVRLGNCRLFLNQAPDLWQNPTVTGRYFLYVTYSGHYLPLPDQTTITIGREDPSLGFKPDIDLSNEGDVASVVSRRHAKITRRENQFLVEDMGSALMTRVDGEPVPVGIQVPIQPGQHLWLGGCILAFDVVEA